MYIFISKTGKTIEISEEYNLKKAREMAEKVLGEVDYVGTLVTQAQEDWYDVFFGEENV